MEPAQCPCPPSPVLCPAVAHASGLPLDGSAPCLLLVYGAYGHSLPADWDPSRLPLLSRGWVLALAHVRGGGELGRGWHAAGRGVRKRVSASDLGACLDALVAAGLASPGRVALEAASAGALAAGGLLAARPSDVAAALLEVPFLDLLTTMCLPELPLTGARGVHNPCLALAFAAGWLGRAPGCGNTPLPPPRRGVAARPFTRRFPACSVFRPLQFMSTTSGVSPQIPCSWTRWRQHARTLRWPLGPCPPRC